MKKYSWYANISEAILGKHQIPLKVNFYIRMHLYMSSYRENFISGGRKNKKIISARLSLCEDISPEECYDIMNEHMPKQYDYRSIYTTLLFVQ